MSEAISDPLPSQYHPNFEREVFPVVFLVDGRKFRTDASRLAEHSEFLQGMLFGSSDLGISNEGSDDNPIVVHGCSQSTFANFLSWLNHITWESLTIEPLQGNLDILHMCHMWEIHRGLEHAINELEQLHLHPAHKIYLARKYEIAHWFPSAIYDLLRTPFDQYTQEHCDYIGFPIYSAIACAKENVQRACQHLSSSLPYPRSESMDLAPYCSAPTMCKQVWFTVWIREIGKLVHNPTHYTPSSRITSTLRGLAYAGMHPECKVFVIDWIDDNCPGFGREDTIVQNVIAEIRCIM